MQATYFFLFSAGAVPSVSILNEDSRVWKPGGDADSDSLISCLTNSDIFALLIAAIGHDVGHPGLTNAFLVGELPSDIYHIANGVIEKCQDPSRRDV